MELDPEDFRALLRFDTDAELTYFHRSILSTGSPDGHVGPISQQTCAQSCPRVCGRPQAGAPQCPQSPHTGCLADGAMTLASVPFLQARSQQSLSVSRVLYFGSSFHPFLELGSWSGGMAVVPEGAELADPGGGFSLS